MPRRVNHKDALEQDREFIAHGEACFAAGKLQEAEDHFQKVISRDPKNARAYNNLGVLAFQKGDVPAAVQLINKAISLNPEYQDAAVNASEILFGLSKEQRISQSIQFLPYLLVRQRAGTLNEDEQFVLNTAKSSLTEKDRAILNGTSSSSVRPVPDSKVPLAAPVIKSARPVADGDPLIGKRILLGSYEIGNQMRFIAKALVHNQISAKTLICHPNYLAYQGDYLFDPDTYQNGTEALQANHKMAEDLIGTYDLFHFHFHSTLTLDHADLPILKNLNKPMVMQYWGSDCRTLTAAKKLNPYAIAKSADHVVNKQLDFFNKYIDHCIATDAEVYEYLKEKYQHVHRTRSVIDLAEFPPSPVQNETFLIVHAPTSPEIKGSSYIIEALEDLKHSYDFEFKLVTGLPHAEARKIYAQADLIIDQLHAGTYGIFCIECMAMGKPVITWVSDFMRENHPADLPIISANPDTIREKIEYALRNRDHLLELGKQGRAYVSKYHDVNKEIFRYMEVYREICGP